eukprot:Platyproteum_vivax@DN8243_c0_g1_i1.p1
MQHLCLLLFGLLCVLLFGNVAVGGSSVHERIYRATNYDTVSSPASNLLHSRASRYEPRRQYRAPDYSASYSPSSPSYAPSKSYDAIQSEMLRVQARNSILKSEYLRERDWHRRADKKKALDESHLKLRELEREARRSEAEDFRSKQAQMRKEYQQPVYVPFPKYGASRTDAQTVISSKDPAAQRNVPQNVATVPVQKHSPKPERIVEEKQEETPPKIVSVDENKKEQNLAGKTPEKQDADQSGVSKTSTHQNQLGQDNPQSIVSPA